MRQLPVLGPPARLAGMALLVCACGDAPTQPPPGGTVPTIVSVTVTAAADTILALGRPYQLSATGRDGSGNTVTVSQFNWSTSNSSVVTVTGSGLATGQTAGSAIITAGVPGSSASGSITVQVVETDLPAVTALGGDPFSTVLLSGLSSGIRTTLEAAWAQCAAAAGAGNLVSLADCVAKVQDGADTATDPTDRVLVALLGMYADQIERRLGL